MFRPHAPPVTGQSRCPYDSPDEDVEDTVMTRLICLAAGQGVPAGKRYLGMYLKQGPGRDGRSLLRKSQETTRSFEPDVSAAGLENKMYTRHLD